MLIVPAANFVLFRNTIGGELFIATTSDFPFKELSKSETVILDPMKVKSRRPSKFNWLCGVHDPTWKKKEHILLLHVLHEVH